MSYTMVILKAGGGREEKVLPKAPELATLQAAVGGLIETLPYFTRFEGHKRCTAYANEEGLMHGLPVNPQATKAWRSAFPQGGNDIGVVGDAVVYWKNPAN